jgi:transposase-like protein
MRALGDVAGKDLTASLGTRILLAGQPQTPEEGGRSMPQDQRRYTDAEREEVVRPVKAGETKYAVAAATGIPYSTVGLWVEKAGKERRYKDGVKDEVVRRVREGESRGSVARDTGIPMPTVCYWVRTRGRGSASGGRAGKTRKAGKGTAGRKAGRPQATNSGGGEAISWAIEGDLLVLRIPLGRIARRAAALQVLAAIKQELGR